MSNCNYDHFLEQKFPGCPFIGRFYNKHLKIYILNYPIMMYVMIQGKSQANETEFTIYHRY